jgi:hypothetical protein
MSALHIAQVSCQFPNQLLDPRVAVEMSPFAIALDRWLLTQQAVDPLDFWSVLIAFSEQIPSNLELASRALQRFGIQSEMSTTMLAGWITDIEASFQRLFPRYGEQILLRARPLQEQWLGYGNGLMAHLKRMTEKELLANSAEVVLLQPVTGGAVYPHIERNLVRIEAVLTNPLPELPEIVRLTWGLAQLHLDLPVFSESMGNRTLHRLAPLAMLPPTLAAAEVLELSRCTEAIAELAIEHWHIPIPKELNVHTDVVPALMGWWETYLHTRPKWHTAMQALQKMLGLA